MAPSPIEQSRSEADQSRLISFSDNVLSVAITVLVFDVRVPANWTQLELGPAIVALLPRVLGFALSFAVIGVYWVAHHIMFRAATHVNRGMLWINNLFLMTVCLIPASAALLGAFPGQRAGVVIYGGNLLATAGSMRLLWFYILRFHDKLGKPIDPALQRSGKRRLLAGVLLALTGIAFAWIDPWVSYAVYWIAPLSFVLVQFWVS